ncbi:MAG TPA: alpha/beta fold hydrolase, partial [Pseudonocardiaceae bacterium]|nr:alpha/beta fold hydrolase [Pseudonocardiaceae bacterium]
MTTGDENVTVGLAGRRALRDPARVWFVSSAPRPDAAVALFCLPYAGAGPSAFHQWPKLLGPDVDVAAVALPGREGRFAEPPDWDVTELAGAVTARANSRRYALYGHSMGAKMAVEIVRELRHRGDPLPVLVAIGGSRAPH